MSCDSMTGGSKTNGHELPQSKIKDFCQLPAGNPVGGSDSPPDCHSLPPTSASLTLKTREPRWCSAQRIKINRLPVASAPLQTAFGGDAHINDHLGWSVVFFVVFSPAA